jgi:DNA (cytosine-5)-methyltransferase 1
MGILTYASLFTGIGGFDIGAEQRGWRAVLHCEKDEFCKRVIRYYWPDTKFIDDVTTEDFSRYRGWADVLFGGFPCQPYSNSGKRKGTEDDRHLWPNMLGAIRAMQPRWVVGENVHGLITWNRGLVFDEVQSSLEAEGYKVQSYVLPASSVQAPSQRYRVFIIGYKEGMGTHLQERSDTDSHGTGEGLSDRGTMEVTSGEVRRGAKRDVSQLLPSEGTHTHGDSFRLQGGIGSEQQSIQQAQGAPSRGGAVGMVAEEIGWADFPTVSPLLFRDDGIPTGLDTEAISYSKWIEQSIKGAGNAVVPAMAKRIFDAIEQYESLNP